METKKQEAIRLAYGEYWEKVKDFVNDDGCVKWSLFSKELEKLDCDFHWNSANSDRHSMRPKSLKGLYNNNGWISILSEEDFPKESGKYFIVTNGKIQVGAYILNYKRWFADGCYYSDTYQNLGITHYQPIIEPNLPIF